MTSSNLCSNVHTYKRMFCGLLNSYPHTTAVGVEESHMTPDYEKPYYPYYGTAGIIAINMIMAAASGGILAILIAVWAQVRLYAYCIHTYIYMHNYN